MLTDPPLAVDAMLREALAASVSDIHVEPVAGGYDIRFRRDGLLETHDHTDTATGRAMVTRLMVLAQLLTYRQDIPQEGRIPWQVFQSDTARQLDLRLAIMPTALGLRAAIRLPAELHQPRQLESLGLPEEVIAQLATFAHADSGMLIVTGPAGSGKTTTIYALLEFIARNCPGQSIISLEDPVERQIPGVTQIEIQPFGELTYDRALKSILRQDPQVLMLGEIRDAATASLAIQAALSGHRLICTFHAASAVGAIARLFEMGLEPYQITSSLFAVLTQRLVRRRKSDGGYEGRVPLAEMVTLNDSLRRGILDRLDAAELGKIVGENPDFMSIMEVGRLLVSKGVTDQAELSRVLGAPAA